MQGTPVNKIMNLIDKLSDEDRATIAGTYYKKDEKELSPKVTRLKKVFDKLDSDEQNDFVVLCGARMLDGAKGYEADDSMGVGVVISSEEEETPDDKPEEDLSDK